MPSSVQLMNCKPCEERGRIVRATMKCDTEDWCFHDEKLPKSELISKCEPSIRPLIGTVKTLWCSVIAAAISDIKNRGVCELSISNKRSAKTFMSNRWFDEACEMANINIANEIRQHVGVCPTAP